MKRMMLLFVCCLCIGCASTRQGVERPDAQRRSAQKNTKASLQATLAQKDQEIQALHNEIYKQDQMIKQKDEKINELKKQLEMVGIFVK